MASKPLAADSSNAAASRDRRWHPGTRVTVAILLAFLSWAPILLASVLLGR